MTPGSEWRRYAAAGARPRRVRAVPRVARVALFTRVLSQPKTFIYLDDSACHVRYHVATAPTVWPPVSVFAADGPRRDLFDPTTRERLASIRSAKVGLLQVDSSWLVPL
jgi:hypothetical protein